MDPHNLPEIPYPDSSTPGSGTSTPSLPAGSLTLPWLYLLWVGLVWISAYFNQSYISSDGVAILLGGAATTNAFFVGLARGLSQQTFSEDDIAVAQSTIAIAWIAAYTYFSAESGELVLGMYMTVMTFAIFRLDTWAFLKISIFAGLSYVVAVGLQWAANPLAVDLWQSAFRLLLLQAVMIWGLIYARQFRELRNQLQFRNEELQSMIARVSKIAAQDHLTKSFNRRYIMEALAREKARSDRTGKTFSVAIFDLDHFKSVNDKYGHLIGDQILLEFAKRVKGEFRAMDTVDPGEFKRSFGRFGGEEFIAVLPTTNLEGAFQCADRIRTSISERMFIDLMTITVSAGVAQYRAGETVPEILTRADQALYGAKQNGRDQVHCAGLDLIDDSHTVPNLRILS